MYSLIGSVVPCTFSRVDSNDPEREDNTPNAKDDSQAAENNIQEDGDHTQEAEENTQDAEEDTGGNEADTVEITPSSEAQQNIGNKDDKVGDDTSKENTPGTENIAPETNGKTDETEANFAETGTTEQSGEPNEFEATRRNTGRELSAIFCFHATSVLLGAVAFTVMQYTSTDFLASCAKVKEASRIDLTKAVYIGGPLAFLASVVFRILHSRLGPWRIINKQPSCCTVCPPLLETEIEHFKVKLPNAIK